MEIVVAVSVIMPLYNSEKFMKGAIQSVLEQTYTDFELVLVDDCSKDATLDLARTFSLRDSRVKVLALQINGGSGSARNAGINIARGRFIAFLDSDDRWDNVKLDVQLRAMNAKRATLSYTDYNVCDDEGEEKFTFISPETIDYVSMAKRPSIGCSTAIYDSRALGKRYFPSIRKSEDFALWLSILRDIGIAYKCGETLTHYTARSDSVSSNKLRSAQYTWRVYRELEKLPFHTALIYFAHYVCGNIIKRIAGRRLGI